MRFKAKIEVSENIRVGPYPPNNPSALKGGVDQIILAEKYKHGKKLVKDDREDWKKIRNSRYYDLIESS